MGKVILANQIAVFLNQLYLQNKIKKIAWFFACWYKFMNIKSWLENIFWCAWSEIGVATLFMRL